MNLVLYINNTLDNINNKTNSINYHYMKLVELGLDPNKIFDIESKNGTQLVERSIRYGKN